VRLPSERNFRIVALAEATSFLTLLAATYLKYGQDQPIGVKILGPIHGLLFIAYGLLALHLGQRARWRKRTTALVLLAPAALRRLHRRPLARPPGDRSPQLTTTPAGPTAKPDRSENVTPNQRPREIVA